MLWEPRAGNAQLILSGKTRRCFSGEMTQDEFIKQDGGERWSSRGSGFAKAWGHDSCRHGGNLCIAWYNLVWGAGWEKGKQEPEGL